MNSDCTREQFTAVTNGIISFSRSYVTQQTGRGISGYTATELTDLFNKRINGSDLFAKSFISVAYDGMWMMALGLNRSYYVMKENGTY